VQVYILKSVFTSRLQYGKILTIFKLVNLGGG